MRQDSPNLGALLGLRSVIASVVFGAVACAFGQGYSPEVAPTKMALPEGFSVSLFASEPEIRQPNLVKCDSRGRLWVIQYLQYPNPAGLTRVKVDRWSRTVYDRVPEPPPHGPRGADRITILEDADGDGSAERVKDFVAGLNLATGLEFGHGGVYVLQVPYLLFYPDGDRDDVPDGDPEVLLEGFGMEDAQSLANHLTWGPDGWLYGVNGSTTTCNIRGIEFQQGVWRYHPLSREFELYCEGGGNLYGLTFDDRGNLFYSSNGGLFYHAVQGGYFEKNFGKHGPLHNPYAYGYFGSSEPDAPTGGPTTGGTVYLGDSFPAAYRGTFIAGNFLGHGSSFWQVEPRGSTVRSKFGGLLLDANDTWFGATDMCLAPDGSMFLADFHDRRTAHPDPDAQWDRSNGRIYKIEYRGTRRVAGLDLESQASQELVDLLAHPNGWYAQQARRILADRRDPAIIKRLRELAMQPDNHALARQGLWATYVSGGFDDSLAASLLDHPSEDVRAWAVRLLGDARQVSPDLARRLADLAASDPSAIVRAQLAATAKRLPGAAALPIVAALLSRDIDEGDPRLSLLLWWAVEAHAIADIDGVLLLFARPEAWTNEMSRESVRRLMRRYAADGTARGYAACVRLWQATPPHELDAMKQALDQGLAERVAPTATIGDGGLFANAAAVRGDATDSPAPRFEPISGELRALIAENLTANAGDATALRLALRAESSDAQTLLREAIASGPTEIQIERLATAGELGDARIVPVVVPLLEHPLDEFRLAALNALARFVDDRLGQQILDLYRGFSPAVQSRARDLLLSRADTTKAFLERIDRGALAAADVPVDQLRRVSLHGDADLDALVRKHWGNIQPGTPEEKLAEMRRLSNDLRAAAGDEAAGKALFARHCGTCHKLFGEGTDLGPDLTTTSRGDRESLLANLVDPSAVIRSQYISHIVVTTGGVIHTGLIAEQDAASLTLVDPKNQRTRIPREEIAELGESPISLMPERILEPLTPQELRDLFAYLQR